MKQIKINYEAQLSINSMLKDEFFKKKIRFKKPYKLIDKTCDLGYKIEITL
jgi:hypothetical protein